MAGAAKLKIESIDNVKLIEFSYSMAIQTDATGRPIGDPRGGTVTMTIESTKSTFLPKWMANTKTTKAGTITVEDAVNKDSSMKKINFEDAHLISYSERYSATGANNMLETFTISAKKLTIDGDGAGTFTNEWPAS